MCKMEDVVDNSVNGTPPPAPPLPCAQPKRVLVKSKGISSYKDQCSVSTATTDLYDRLFDEAYRADVVVHTDDGGQIYAHANILGMTSPVIRHLVKESKGKNRRRSITIRGVPHDAVRVFIRFLYSSCYNPEDMEEYILHLLVLSHVYVVPHLKRECEVQLENGLLNIENSVDIFQLALLCDAPRLSLICHRMILDNFKAVSATDGWNAMKEAHPILEREILATVAEADRRQRVLCRKRKEKEMYVQLYEAMEALVHICRDGCKTIGPHDKALKEDEHPCGYTACKGLEQLVRHFAACKLRVPGGCAQCKRMWQLFELHSRLCIDSEACRVPLCRNFKDKSMKQNKKEEMRWKILARKIVRSKSISGAPFFSLASST
ncbi:BTB/POZ and TAZ domain-containing protein 4-like [Chenopodium quinoa]|uniref:BTB/POZ and TAZ domain-containing protein 4-like n=1 Tax=Chenopodium quinoa TaxID=63459 RepID=UPI000B771649|nr:BTB/POZ and TAZ domain-containing protein 4-like [Chenopodium quinoa]XP_021751427.1 BTB/POZ and TAZ domain-containing protein 4-like [Chenopodium quinoa]